MKQWLKEWITPAGAVRPGSSKILYLDFLKVLAAFMVVFYHFAYYKLDYGFVQGIRYFPNGSRLLMSLCASSVPLFFIVNGELMFRRHRQWKDVYRKAVKVGVLMVFWTLFAFPAWFFRTLIAVYVLFPMLQFFYEKKKVLFVLGECALFAMPFLYNLAVLLLKVLGIAQIGPVSVASLGVTGLFTMYGVLYFMLGAQMQQLRKWPAWVQILVFAAGYGLTLFETVFYTNSNQAMYDGVNAAFPTVGALLMAVGIYCICSRVRFEKMGRFLYLAGEGVLPVYLTHMWLINCIKKAAVNGFGLNLFTAILGTALIYCCCCAIGYVVKKVPVLCALMKM